VSGKNEGHSCKVCRGDAHGLIGWEKYAESGQWQLVKVQILGKFCKLGAAALWLCQGIAMAAMAPSMYVRSYASIATADHLCLGQQSKLIGKMYW
jgi:hypothetical protein